MCTCRYQAQSNLFCYQSELMLRMKFSILRSCLCATSCDLELHALLYTFKSGLLDFFPDTALQPSRTPAPDCLQFLQFVGIMRILPNLNSYKKYTRGIISVAGALLERTWNRLPSCNYSLSFLQACNLNHINMPNFFCESFSCLDREERVSWEDSQELYILKYYEAGEPL